MPNGYSGFVIHNPGKWKDSGIKEFDIILSSNLSGAISSKEKIEEVLNAPNGTTLIILRDKERIDIVLK